MADKEPRQPTHRVYSVFRREGQDDYWLNIGLVFPHKGNGGFNIMLQAFPFDGKIVVREITAEDEPQDPPQVVNAQEFHRKGGSATLIGPQRAPCMSPGLVSLTRPQPSLVNRVPRVPFLKPRTKCTTFS